MKKFVAGTFIMVLLAMAGSASGRIHEFYINDNRPDLVIHIHVMILPNKTPPKEVDLFRNILKENGYKEFEWEWCCPKSILCHEPRNLLSIVMTVNKECVNINMEEIDEDCNIVLPLLLFMDNVSEAVQFFEELISDH